MAPEVLDALSSMAPDRIVYVSCNVRSLVRDLEQLTERGYTLREVRAIDMFPHTPHVESVSLLRTAAVDKGDGHGK